MRILSSKYSLIFPQSDFSRGAFVPLEMILPPELGLNDKLVLSQQSIKVLPALYF